jgi:cytochrome b561
VGPRVDAFNLHKSMGMTILMLMLLRLAWRTWHRPPALPAMALWQSRLALGTHIALYVALLVQPLVGYLGSEFSGYPVRYFGITLPSWAGRHVELKEILSFAHLCVGWLITALIAMHVAGAAKHALVDRDGLLARMGIGKGRLR